MANADRSERLADLLGVGGEAIRWSHGLVIFIAFLASEVIATLLVPALCSTRSVDVWLPAGYWLHVLTDNVIIVACVLAAFRYERRALAAAALAALAYTAIMYPAASLLGRLTSFRSLSPLVASWNRFVWAFLLLAGLVLALRWLRSAWLALAVGAAVGGLVSQLVRMVTWWLAPSAHSIPFTLELRSVLYSALYPPVSAVLFTVLIWAGLEMAHAGKGRMSKPFFLGSLGGADLVALASVPVTLSHVSDATAIILLILNALLFLYAVVVGVILLYRMWDAIQDGHARTSPGKAVGLLFVPIFNLYWIFQVAWGFARDYNRYVDRHDLKTRKLPAWLFLVLTITGFFIMIPAQVFPPLFLCLTLANMVAALVLIAKICDAVNALPESVAAVPSILGLR
jgi:hypothetical protein